MLGTLKGLVLVCWVLSVWGSPLEGGGRREGGGGGRGKHHRAPRQVAYLPVFAFPPVYHIHQVVLVQPEDRCRGGGAEGGGGRPTAGVGPAAGPGDDLANRFGGGETDGSKEPSRCVWSIVACCAPGSRNIRYTCFELLGCPGAFWDTNPCDEKVVMAAANTALRFYERNSTDSRRR